MKFSPTQTGSYINWKINGLSQKWKNKWKNKNFIKQFKFCQISQITGFLEKFSSWQLDTNKNNEDGLISLEWV